MNSRASSSVPIWLTQNLTAICMSCQARILVVGLGWRRAGSLTVFFVTFRLEILAAFRYGVAKLVVGLTPRASVGHDDD